MLGLRVGVPLHLHLSPTTEIGAVPLPLTGLHSLLSSHIHHSSTQTDQEIERNNENCEASLVSETWVILSSDNIDDDDAQIMILLSPDGAGLIF